MAQQHQTNLEIIYIPLQLCVSKVRAAGDLSRSPEKCNVAGTMRGLCCMDTKGVSSELLLKV